MASLNPSDQYSQLSTQIQQKFQVNQQTREIYEQKNQWRAEMEGIVRELYPSSRLVLSGSSANGFGSAHSDIDLVLCFDRVSSTMIPSMLRRIESLFIRNPRRFQTEVLLQFCCFCRVCNAVNCRWRACFLDAWRLEIQKPEVNFLSLPSAR